MSTGPNRLIAHLLYGSGLRLSEALRLRVKELDVGTNRLHVRDGKGGTDRSTVLPERLHGPLRRHLKTVKAQHEADCADGVGGVSLPDAIAEKYPNAETEWRWQYVFPSTTLSEDPRSGAVRRHHRSDSAVQRAVKKAAEATRFPGVMASWCWRGTRCRRGTHNTTEGPSGLAPAAQVTPDSPHLPGDRAVEQARLREASGRGEGPPASRGATASVPDGPPSPASSTAALPSS
ncbi:tyrosine-type recombinase/integrase [Salinibacter ruber]|uniref:tyrosine-type recombinase/integrase n=1 Tax=Salinibacter ruber TaxID=146919 RepID=UPI002072C286